MTVFDDEEDEMHPIVREHLENEFSDLYLFHEFRNGTRRADFAGGTIDDWAVQKRVDTYGVPEPLPHELRHAARIAEQTCPAPKDSLIQELPDDPHIPDRMAFQWLVESNYLLEDSDSWYRFSRPPEVLDEAFAFELKRPKKKWEDALRQAISYRESFANKSYVVMDASSKSTVIKKSAQFENEGVGLAFADYDGMEIVVEPRTRHHPDGYGPRSNLSELAFLEDCKERGVPKSFERMTEERLLKEIRAQHTAKAIDEIRE